VGEDSITRRTRGYLPHWEREGATYFITFRLGDSLPAPALEKICRQQRAIEQARNSGRQLLPVESVTAKRTASRRVEAHLDAREGECLFKRPELAKIVADALRYDDTRRYGLEAWCVMPNHVHVLVTMFAAESLAEIVAAWKSVSVHRIHLRLSRRGPIWRPESYDHLVRDEEEFDRAVQYIRDNPVKAGLKDWPWVYVKLPRGN
jgi:REP element-mobilizing transposase RayT